MAPYRAPFPTPGSRRPILALPRDLPIEGEPAGVRDALQSARAALAALSYPKLLFAGEPGALVSPAFAASFAATLKPCALVRLGPGLRYHQEDHAEAIGRSVAGWIAGIEAVREAPLAA
jgi:haloalkane dehalogenase